ncbi:Trp biosynthesis-associated membrane protein [Natronoglycomyces albus]|uniref:Trp biosynthesis-associated membrane protein n=1 Tax=Natronoglycomyces albus TaxID=2811108 RepID=A0A895XPM7_9ACTN|nr:Trp biosynthesis-associated membrane protein [Natronoglycomyces albus]QSB04230.1 Trp biosynthesis-associated membrane protein [Natronoglycomyces albus]
MTHLRRGTALLAGLALTGLALLTITRAWGHETLTRSGPLPDITEPISGTDVAAWALPTALVAGAAYLALLAVGAKLRRVLLVLAALASLGPLSGGIRGLMETPGLFSGATVALSLALLTVSVAAFIASPGWDTETSPKPGTDHSEREDEAQLRDPEQIWKALDAGYDPTSSTISTKAAKEEKPR